MFEVTVHDVDKSTRQQWREAISDAVGDLPFGDRLSIMFAYATEHMHGTMSDPHLEICTDESTWLAQAIQLLMRVGLPIEVKRVSRIPAVGARTIGQALDDPRYYSAPQLRTIAHKIDTAYTLGQLAGVKRDTLLGWKLTDAEIALLNKILVDAGLAPAA